MGQRVEAAQRAGLVPALLVLERTRIGWTGALLPLFVFGQGRYVLLAVALWAALWLATGLSTGAWGRRMPVEASLAVWLLLIPVTLAVTATPALTQEHLGYFLAELIAFYTVATWATTAARLRGLAWGLVGAGVGLAGLTALSALQNGRLALPAVLVQLVPFPLQDTVNKNVMGGILAVLLPLAVGLLIAQFRPRQAHPTNPAQAAQHSALSTRHSALTTLVAGAGVLVIGGALALSESRGAYLGAAAGLGLMAVVQWRPLRWVAGAVVLGGVVLAVTGQLAPLAGDLLRFDSLGGPDLRLAVWTRALYALHDFPLTGIGLGGFPQVIPALYPYLDDPHRVIPHAHNIFLQVGVDLGVPGLLAFIAFVVVVAVLGTRGWARWRRAGAGDLAGLALGGLGALTALLVHGQVDAVTWGTKPAPLAWATLGLLLAVGLLRPAPAGERGLSSS